MIDSTTGSDWVGTSNTFASCQATTGTTSIGGGVFPNKLPKVKANALTDQKDPIEITVNLDGEIYIGESLVEVENLIPRINAITEQNTEARIYIRGDRVVAYGRVMEIMSIINSAGYIKVALITQNMK